MERVCKEKMIYQVVTDLNRSYARQLQELFACPWWTKDRTLLAIEQMLASSVCVGVVDADKNLVGFARAITDGVFKALVVDVMVAPDHQTKGLSKLLMEALFGHQALIAVEDFELYCQPSLVGLYKRWGFQESPNSVVFMRAKRGGHKYASPEEGL